MFKVALKLEKSVTIAKPVGEVFAAVGDFHTWGHWSPWLCQEPECPVTIAGSPATVGQRQAWEGTFIGKGRQELVRVEADRALDYQLTFLAPWKSTAKAGFRFDGDDTQTTVTWWMDGSLPIFMFFMKKMMLAWIGADYTRGLKMLDEYLTTGEVASEVTVGEAKAEPGFTYLGRRRETAIAEMGPSMRGDFEALASLLAEGKVSKPDHVVSVYHRFDIANGRCDYTAAFAYRDAPSQTGGLTAATVPAHRALHVQHKGAYHHLGNAWSAAQGCGRTFHKIDKRTPMYEVYVSDPAETPEGERIVDVCVPVK